MLKNASNPPPRYVVPLEHGVCRINPVRRGLLMFSGEVDAPRTSGFLYGLEKNVVQMEASLMSSSFLHQFYTMTSD